MDERRMYASDGQYFLLKLSDEDKEYYIELQKQLSDSPAFYDKPENVDMVWECCFHIDAILYSIYDKSGDYCGYIILKHPEEKTPEIGIDLIETKRNQGIAVKSIRMFARKVFAERDDIEYLELKVLSENTHSKHMIEKMGAIYIGTEERLFEKAKLVVQDKASQFDEKTKQVVEKIFAEGDEEKAVVYRYKVTRETIAWGKIG